MLASAGIDAYIIPVYGELHYSGHSQLKIIIVFLVEILTKFETYPEAERHREHPEESYYCCCHADSFG